jgi:hypothetical protein
MPYVDERLATIALRRVDTAVATLAGQTGAARAATVRTAVETLLSIRRDFADAPSAARVPQALQTLGVAAERPFAEAQFCAVLPTLDYAVTLPEAETGAIVATARDHRPQTQLGCGLAEFRAGRFPQAATAMQDLLDDYPADPGGKPTQDARLTGGLYHVLLRPTGSRRMTVRTLTAVDGAAFCVYAVPAGPSI